MNLRALLIALALPTSCLADWPQAAGPDYQYVVEDGVALKEFSVARNEGVIWRTPLPNTGESTPIISGDRIFLTCHTPIAVARSGSPHGRGHDGSLMGLG